MLFMLVKISSCRRYFGIEIWNFWYPHQKFIIIKFHWWQLEKIELSNFRGLRVLEWTKECSRHSIESASCSRCDGLLTIVEFLYDINAHLPYPFLIWKILMSYPWSDSMDFTIQQSFSAFSWLLLLLLFVYSPLVRPILTVITYGTARHFVTVLVWISNVEGNLIYPMMTMIVWHRQHNRPRTFKYVLNAQRRKK